MFPCYTEKYCMTQDSMLSCCSRPMYQNSLESAVNVYVVCSLGTFFGFNICTVLNPEQWWLSQFSDCCGLYDQGSILSGEFFSLLQCPDQLRGPPSILSSGYQGSFLWGKAK